MVDTRRKGEKGTVKTYKVAKNKSTLRGLIQEERLLILLLHLLYLLLLFSSAVIVVVDEIHSSGRSMTFSAVQTAVRSPVLTNFIYVSFFFQVIKFLKFLRLIIFLKVTKDEYAHNYQKNDHQYSTL